MVGNREHTKHRDYMTHRRRVAEERRNHVLCHVGGEDIDMIIILAFQHHHRLYLAVSIYTKAPSSQTCRAKSVFLGMNVASTTLWTYNLALAMEDLKSLEKGQC